MAEMIDDIAHITQDIGPHPSGTEEEQQVALYLAEKIQGEAGFQTIVEDFKCVVNDQVPRLICFGIALLSVLFALIAPAFAVFCLVLAIVATVLFALEVAGKPVLSRLLRTGVSQNVVAKYQPGIPGASARRRKVILVANYDSGKVLMEEKPPIARFLPILQKASGIALIAAPVLLLLRTALFSGESNPVGAVLSFLLVICLVLFVLPVVRSVLHIVAPYSQSANNNASGTAVLVQVARMVGQGLVSNDELAQRAEGEGATVHGEEAARAAGAVPQGATIEYDTETGSRESLAAAKAAIAALTGKPLADTVPVSDISHHLVHGGGLIEEDESASTMRFEETPQRPLRQRHHTPSRTMVSSDEPGEEYRHPAFSRAQGLDSDADEALAADAAVEAEAEAQAAGQAGEPEQSSFKRQTPAALQNTPASSAVADKTPAWARAAQAKARVNKPAASQSHSVSRSRYADAPAARMADAQRQPLVFSAGEPSDSPFGGEEPVSEQSELSRKLAALRSEIEAAEAPHAPEAPEVSAAPAQASASAAETVPAAEVAPTAKPESASSGFETEPESAPAAEASFGGDQPGEEQVPEEAAEPAPHRVPRPRARSAKQPTGFAAALSQRAHGLRSRVNFAPRGEASTPEAAAGVTAPEVVEGVAEETAQVPFAAEASEEVQATKAMPAVSDTAASATESAPAAASPSATTAMPPIDVSSYFDKEELDEPESEPLTAAGRIMAGRVSVPYGEDIEGGYAPQAEPMFDGAAAEAATQRVSTAEIQEAIQEASREVNLPPREESAQDLEGAAPVSPIVGMDAILPQIQLADDSESAESEPAKVIVLPDVVATHTSEGGKQRAPMAAASENTQAGTKSLLSNMLPSIEEPASEEPRDSFGFDLPSIGAAEPVQQAVSVTGSFSTVGGTGSFAPVGDELVADIAPEDRYVDDADDSAYDESYTETGAFAGPGYVDMPKSRVGSFFGRFRKKNKNVQPEPTVGEWVGADENYDSRSVGKARGDWSSFRDDQPDDFIEEPQSQDGLASKTVANPAAAAAPVAQQTVAPAAPADDDGFVPIDYHASDFDDRRGWKGGAFSLKRLRKGAAENELADQQPDVAPAEGEAEGYVAENPAVRIDGDIDAAEEINRELRKLQDFRHPNINTEVWFVALGSEMYSHSGMNAFLEEHADELKGAIIINLEALGAGTLTALDSEGVYKTVKPSSRIKRALRQASERSGVAYRTASMSARETAASTAMAHGVQALTICGMGDGNTALYAAENDVIENMDEDQLNEAADFVMNILKAI